MVKPVTGLSILLPILRLNFITKLIFIHLHMYTSLSTADLTTNFLESNIFTPTKYGIAGCSENNYLDFR